MTRAGLLWLPLLGLVACADIWGFQDLHYGSDAAGVDSQAGGDSSVPVGDGANDRSIGDEGPASQDAADARSDYDADGAVEADSASSGGDSGIESGSDAGGPRGDAGDGGIVVDASDASPSVCQQSCASGCCLQGQCQSAGDKTNACGTGGVACVDCTAIPSLCGTLSSPCCSSKHACACAGLGITCP